MVLPSSIFEAAFPVEATQTIRCMGCPFFFDNKGNTVLIMPMTKVLPVPGPPEISVNLLYSAFLTAFFWGRRWFAPLGKKSFKISSVRVFSMGIFERETRRLILSVRRF